jgi:hypothetical protein
MSELPIYISKDIDRIIFITASMSGFFFIVTWLLHGANKLIGEETDWTPIGYDAIQNIAKNVSCTAVCCRRRAVYEVIESENSEPEDEDEGCGGSEAKMCTDAIRTKIE